ncbi:subtilase-type protease inhibitor [Streptomyces sp. NPDC046805]|uniref:subtilase-type protease inhibitor n=1 Tax=Streptomyces sp. NPDC046805 TaxID=3155134 RepID=UPI0033E7BA59
MTHTITATAVRGALLAAAALLAVGPAPAAHAATPAQFPGTWLDLTVTRGETVSGDARGTLLTCLPPQGHPHAAKACAELDAAHGDIGALPPNHDVLCPMIYAPVTVQAYGVWQGRPVAFRHTFSNACEMAARTGAVFALDA